MAHICRLCLNSECLIDMFDNSLKAQDQLRTYILLCTGVNIQESDKVSKYVCHSCCIIAVKLFKYRKNAIANDKALKEYIGQDYIEPTSSKEEVIKLHSTILNKISKTNITQSIKTLYDIYDNNVNACNNNKEKSEIKTSYEKFAVHPSIMKLYKIHPRVIIPNDILKSNIEPTLVLDKQLVDEWEFPDKEDEDTSNLDDMDTFKLKFPGINITRISAMKCETSPKKEQNDERNVVVSKPIEQVKLHPTSAILNTSSTLLNTGSTTLNTCSTLSNTGSTILNTGSTILNTASTILNTASSTLNTEKRRKRSNSESTEIIPPKKKRIFTKESRGFQKVQLPECIPTDAVAQKAIFTSSLELTVSNTAKLDVNSDEIDNNLLQPITKEVLLVCTWCNKVYQSKGQLKNHERVHRKCIICRTVLISQDALAVHLKDVCYKMIECNQPSIPIYRIDEVSDVVARYSDAFDYYFASFKISKENSLIESGSNSVSQTFGDSQLDDDVMCISDDDDVEIVGEVQGTGKTHSVEENINNEHEYVKNIFKRYKTCNKQVEKKPKFVQTYRPENCVKYSKQNHIVLENMYNDLMIYKVPLEMTVSPKVAAYVSYSTKAKVQEAVYSWSECKVQDLLKPMNLQHRLELLHPSGKTPNESHNTSVLAIVPHVNASKALQRFIIPYQQPVGCLTTNSAAANNKTTVLSNYTHTINKSNSPMVQQKNPNSINSSFKTSTNTQNVVGINNALISQNTPNLHNMGGVLLVQNASLLNGLPCNVTNAPCITSVSYEINKTTNTILVSQAQVPTASTTADANRFLRVKAPWELNQCRTE